MAHSIVLKHTCPREWERKEADASGVLKGTHRLIFFFFLYVLYVGCRKKCDYKMIQPT